MPLDSPTPDLGRFAGQTVTGQQVQVQAVPADEGFWVGTSEANRVWVQLTGQAGESAVKVRPGQKVSFTNAQMVTTPPNFAAQSGVSQAEGAQQLQAQGQHIQVAKSAITVSG